MFIITINLLLALIEPSSLRTSGRITVLVGHDTVADYNVEQTAILVLELLFLAFYGLDIWLRHYAGENVRTDTWVRIRVVAMLCMCINLLACLASTSGLKNFSRLLRPLLFVERLRNVRKIASSTISTLPKVIQVLLLLSFWVIFFGVAAFTLFAGVVGPTTLPPMDNATEFTTIGCDFLSGGIAYVQNMPARLSKQNATFFACSTFSKVYPDGSPCLNYFDTIWTSIMHLFILLTTANYPDVMMPVYDCSPWSSLFFILFITVGLYFLLSLILAVVYTHFAARNAIISERMAQKKTKSLSHAFQLMYELTQHEGLVERRKGEGEGEGEGKGEKKGGEEKAEQKKEKKEPQFNGQVQMDQKNNQSSLLNDDDDDGLTNMSHITNITPHGSISRQIWIRVIQQYRPALPVEIVESLFAMHDRDGSGFMTWEQFVAAVEHTRLKISISKKKAPPTTPTPVGRDRTDSVLAKAELQITDCRRRMRMVLRYRYYELILDFLICVNTFFMLLRLTPGALSWDASNGIGSGMTILLFIFVLEICVKCYALSPSAFWHSSHFNKIDVFAIGGGVVLTIIQWINPPQTIHDAPGGSPETQESIEAEDSGSLSDIFLLVRMIRMLRILRMNEAFRVISATIVEIAPALCRYLAVLAGLFYAFAIIGMECFAGLLSRECLSTDYESMQECEQRVNRLEHSSYGQNNYWSNNFLSLPRALVTLFEQMVRTGMCCCLMLLLLQVV